MTEPPRWRDSRVTVRPPHAASRSGAGRRAVPARARLVGGAVVAVDPRRDPAEHGLALVAAATGPLRVEGVVELLVVQVVDGRRAGVPDHAERLPALERVPGAH